ncbi:DUF222 domain-containing protein [Flexivirga sp.]|uniref:DUF222 domain-containing protein n=1 Tax=Flexivirga sp. TaxID=1962927 RepID=UPI003F814D39
MTQALRQGSCSVESARTALTQADKVGPVIPTADRDEVLGWFLQIDPGLGCAGLTLLTRRIIARFAPDQLSLGDEKLERTETLTWGTTPTGMTRVVAELAPANATILKDAIMATSAPRPAQPTPEAETGEATHGEQVRDERSPGKRRVDALMDLVGAGARAATSEGVQTAAATVLLTMNLETLTTGSDAATTTSGDVLDAGAARRLACAADLIPAVLGGPSAPPRCRPARTPGHQSHPGRSHPARPRLHLPRLRPATRLLRNPPPHPLVDRRPHLPHRLRTPVQPPPPHRPPAGLHGRGPTRRRPLGPHTRAHARTPHRSSLSPVRRRRHTRHAQRWTVAPARLRIRAIGDTCAWATPSRRPMSSETKR